MSTERSSKTVSIPHFKIGCPLSPRRYFKTVEIRDTHFLTCHADQYNEHRYIRCPVRINGGDFCTRFLASMEALHNHLKEAHSGLSINKTKAEDEKLSRTYVCIVCNNIYLSQYEVPKHLRLHKDDERIMECEYPSCDRIFQHPATYRKHFEDHKKTDPMAKRERKKQIPGSLQRQTKKKISKEVVEQPPQPVLIDLTEIEIAMDSELADPNLYNSFIGNTWLVDECVEHFLVLLKNSYPEQRVHVVTTYFYNQLRGSRPRALQYLRNRGLVPNFDLVFIPVHLGNHWVLITLKNNELKFYNPAAQPRRSNRALTNICEAMNEAYDVTLETEIVEVLPRQNNDFDCGVFCIAYAERIIRQSPFDFDQFDIPHFRERMREDLLAKRLSDYS